MRMSSVTRPLVFVGLAAMVCAGLVVSLLPGTAEGVAKKKPPRPDRAFNIPTVELREVSGCAVSLRSPRTVWVHNDSGDTPRVFSVNLDTKAVHTVRITGAEAVDWEDMAALPNGDLLMADIGDNAKQRDAVVLYQVKEPSRTA